VPERAGVGLDSLALRGPFPVRLGLADQPMSAGSSNGGGDGPRQQHRRPVQELAPCILPGASCTPSAFALYAEPSSV
jgi:hypothetical protein